MITNSAYIGLKLYAIFCAEKTTRRNEMKGHLDDFQKARKELEDRSDGTDPTVYQKLMEQYKAEAEVSLLR